MITLHLNKAHEFKSGEVIQIKLINISMQAPGKWRLEAEVVTPLQGALSLKHKRGGRPRVTDRLGWPECYKSVLERLEFGDISKRKAAKELGIGQPTLQRLLDGEHVSQKGSSVEVAKTV